MRPFPTVKQPHSERYVRSGKPGALTYRNLVQKSCHILQAATFLLFPTSKGLPSAYSERYLRSGKTVALTYRNLVEKSCHILHPTTFLPFPTTIIY